MINPQKADLEQGKALALHRLHSRETDDEVNLKNSLILEPIDPQVRVPDALLRRGLVTGGCLSPGMHGDDTGGSGQTRRQFKFGANEG